MKLISTLITMNDYVTDSSSSLMADCLFCAVFSSNSFALNCSRWRSNNFLSTSAISCATSQSSAVASVYKIPFKVCKLNVSIDLEMVDQVYKRTYNSCPVRQHICSYKN